MQYTSFNNYIELHEFIKETPRHERVFHEVALANNNQKPRFDIDISIEDYVKFFGSDRQFVEFGEWMKDVVIETCIEVLRSYNIALEIDRDFAVFSSNSTTKRSYHIILNRFYHHGCEQAKEFYNKCLNCLVNEDTKKIFKTFVDDAAYNKNKSLRLLLSIKGTRVKNYERTFSYKGTQYTQVIDRLSTGKIDIGLQNKIILSVSLVTFTSDSSPMPSFPVALLSKQLRSAEIPDTVLKECFQILNVWNSNNVFEVSGTDDGKICLKRLKSSHCQICNRVHESFPSFCYIDDGCLMYHCGRAKATSGIQIAKLSTVMSGLDTRLRNYRTTKGLVLDNDVHCLLGSGEINSKELTYARVSSFSITMPDSSTDVNLLGLTSTELTAAELTSLEFDYADYEEYNPQFQELISQDMQVASAEINPWVLEIVTLTLAELPINNASSISCVSTTVNKPSNASIVTHIGANKTIVTSLPLRSIPPKELCKRKLISSTVVNTSTNVVFSHKLTQGDNRGIRSQSQVQRRSRLI
jgi:rubrerythrin